jgi:fumarate reductase subunit C
MLVEYFKERKEKLFDIFYILTPLTFFCPNRIFNFVIVLFSAAVLASIFTDFKSLHRKRWSDLYIIAVPFIIALYGFVLDVIHGDLKKGSTVFETYLTLAIFPLLILLTGTTTKRKYLSQLSFFIGSMAAALLCLALALWKNHTDHERMIHNWNFVETLQFYEDHPIGVINWGYFLYMEFASSIKFHPTYLSVYFITAIVFGVSLLGRSRLLNTLIITGILLLITEIFLLSSKMSAIILFVVLLLITVYAVFHSSKRIQQIALISFFTTVVIVLILFPASLYRIHTIVTDLNTSNSTAQQDLSTTNLHRITLWKNAIALFREKPVTGYGLLGTKKAMDSYNARYTTTHFNTHNQYLMFLLIGGCVGALLFLVSQLILLLRSVRAGDYIYAVFLLTILLSLLTENLISRHTGVVLYAFFNALFYLHLCNARDEKI